MRTTSDPQGLIPPLGDPSTRHAEDATVGYASYTPLTINPFDISHIGAFPDILGKANTEIDPAVRRLVEIKQGEYANKASIFKLAHYSSLSLGAALGIVTPFLIPNYPVMAQVTSVAVVFVISFDQIFKPKEKWSLYSKATDLLQLQLFKKSGTYEQNKEIIDTIINTEAQILITVPGLNEVLQQVKYTPKGEG